MSTRPLHRRGARVALVLVATAAFVGAWRLGHALLLLNISMKTGAAL